MESKQSQVDIDIRDLQKLGYVQELFREMGGFSNFAVSFSVISILTGATQLYGYGLSHGGPLQMSLGWLLVSFFTMFVALAMAELASAYPTAGALYHWSHALGGRALGWFTACFNTVGQFAILAGIDYGLAQLLIGVLGWEATRMTSTLVYAALLFSHALFNYRGIRVVAWLNNFSAWYHIVVVLLLVSALAYAGFVQPAEFLMTFHQTDDFSMPMSFTVGLLLAQWTLTGYDASAHVTEETVDPRRNAPWGIFLAVAISVVAGFVMLVAVTLSIQDLAAVAGMGEQAFTHIVRARLGDGFGTLVMFCILGAMWLCGLAGMTSASRMLYAFARDGGLPFSKYIASVSPKHRTPAHAIWTLAVFAMGLAVSVSVYSAVISIATISLYISYGLPIAARLWVRFKGGKDTPGPWNLGRFSTFVAVVAVLWIMVITTVFVLPPNEQAGIVIGTVFLFLLIVWFAVVRHRFQGPRLHS